MLFDHIGQGGMAEIYLARATTDVGATRSCVVKEILPLYAGRADFADMLIKEAKLAARLNHENVVQVFDLERDGGNLYIAMDYVEGFDLAALLKKCSKQKVKLPAELAFHVVSEVLHGLDYAHRAKGEDGKPLGLVHRDVSPSNVLVSFEGEVKLCDFGIAHANALAVASGEEPSEAIKGKAGYMSPEHANGEPLDARADVYAAGIILWELLAGRKLYRASDGPLIEQARAAEIPELPSRGFAHEEELAVIVKKALAKNRDDRYASAADMQRDLDAYVRKASLGANPIKLGDWLREHFGEDMLEQRSARERAAKALENAPVIHPKALRTPPPPVVTYVKEDAAPPSVSLAAMDVSPPSVASERKPEVSDGSVDSKVPVWVWVLVAVVVAAVTFVLSRR
jgi:serine/threonine-protein kinase